MTVIWYSENKYLYQFGYHRGPLDSSFEQAFMSNYAFFNKHVTAIYDSNLCKLAK